MLDGRRHRQVRRGLGVGGEALVGQTDQFDAQWCGVGEGRECRAEAGLGQDRPGRCRGRGRAARRAPCRLVSPAVVSTSASRVSPAALASASAELELVGQCEQPLLGAVVEVAFELAPGVVSGLDDANPRRPQVGELRQRLGAQPFVVDGQPGGSTDLACEIVARFQRPIVDDDRNRLSVALDRGHDLCRSRPRVDLLAAGVDVGLWSWQPVGDVEPVIAERPGERRPGASRARARRRVRRRGGPPTAACATHAARPR